LRLRATTRQLLPVVPAYAARRRSAHNEVCDFLGESLPLMALQHASDHLVQSAPAPAWYAVQVRTTHEKRVAALFDQKGIEHFLPLYRERRRWSDRIKEMERPLFPGYVLCRFGTDGRFAVLKTEGVARIVGIGPVPLPIEDDEIAAIQHVIQCGLALRPHPYLAAGRRVRIDSGPLEGIEGLITDVRSRDRLILSVTLLQRSLSVAVDSAWVSPI
jgi:transcription antitermination factor NusG